MSNGENLDVALNLARNAKQRLPNRPDVDDTLGWIYVKKDMPESAIPLLRAAAARVPNNHFIQYHLGMAYAKAGKVPEARASLQEALRLSSDFAGAEEAETTLASLKQ